VEGTIVGAAIRQAEGVRFIAIDWRAGEMDQTVWKTVDAARAAAEQLVLTGTISKFIPPSIDE
jgi:hypothetical protein